MNQLKYSIIGAGGTGGSIGGYLARAGKDVTLIARGNHLKAMQENGLRFETIHEPFTVQVKACTMEEYVGKADVVFVCVKGYSLEDTISFIRSVAHTDTIVIPILNIYGTGKQLQAQLPEITVTDGCIYIAAQIKEPGTILLSGDIFRIVYGLRKDTPIPVRLSSESVLQTIESDLKDAGILPILSNQVERDTFQKFSFVSPMAAIGSAYQITAADMQPGGAKRDLFISLIKELKSLSIAMEIPLPEDIVDINLKIMDDLASTATASMQRDLAAGKSSEMDGLIFSVLRMGKEYGVDVPAYEKLAEELIVRYPEYA